MDLKAFRDNAAVDPYRLFDAVQPEAVVVGGKLSGYRLMPGADPALFVKAGLKAGDVLLAVNGVKLESEAQAVKLLEQYAGTIQLSLTLQRGKEEINLPVNFQEFELACQCCFRLRSIMHILMVSDVYFPRVNGVSTSIQAFRQALQAAGHRVTLIAPAYAETTDDETDIIRISSRNVIVDPEDRMMRIRHIHRLTDELRADDYDIIHIHTPFVAHYAGLKLARKLKLPVVATYHTFFEEYLYNYIKWLPKEWLRYVARRFSRTQCADLDALVVPSTAMQQVLLDYGVETPLTILPTGLDMRVFESGDGVAFRDKHRIPAERPVILFVGRVAFEKNIGFLLDVTDRLREQIPDILFVIAGEGPAEKSLHSQVKRRGLEGNVSFVGYLRRDGDLQACYKAADVFVFASRTETQGLGTD